MMEPTSSLYFVLSANKAAYKETVPLGVNNTNFDFIYFLSRSKNFLLSPIANCFS